MKKFWVNVGKAAAYLGAYFGAQMMVSFIVSFVLAMIVSAKMVMENGALDMDAYTEKVMTSLSSAMYYILIISGLLTILIFFIVAKIRKKKFMQTAELNKLKGATVAPIIICGIAFNFTISYLMNLIPFPQDWIDSYQASSSEVLGGTGIALWISVVIMAPIVEELTFRCFMYTRLKQGMPTWIAIIVTSLVFGCVHGTIIWAMYTFVFSLALIYVFERTKSLWSSIIFHMSFNFVGAFMSTWPEIGEKIDGIWVMVASIALTLITAVWFTLVSKNKEKAIAEV